ncbi:CAP domain-containing protein [Aquimarina sp. RZ0]|uniref:CAP domain-containing protein n=1 Tax=Aquimarina sp. RZ0 TaxID=2607730 RepID=UPI0011F2C35B|nr:CAP domain-containing protein [Aquimarina sp. RZ0]KAA1247196.1 T9SS type A sorting domain-containing protein [Aquimarina sp. RZ0]
MKLLNFHTIILAIFLLTIFQNGYSQTNDEAIEMLRLVNERRAQEGAQPLRLNTNLNKAAFNHSKDMGDNNYFSHTGLNGSNFSERAIAEGYTGFPQGENIAAGGATVEATFQQWVNSPGHLSNMLNKGHNEMGIGHAAVNGSRYTHYWTQIFGKGDETLSITDHTTTTSMAIYPNPVKDKLHINISNKIQVTTDLNITTITGQIVYKRTIPVNEDIVVNLNHLPQGIYFLTIPNNKALKILKQ